MATFNAGTDNYDFSSFNGGAPPGGTSILSNFGANALPPYSSPSTIGGVMNNSGYDMSTFPGGTAPAGSLSFSGLPSNSAGTFDSDIGGKPVTQPTGNPAISNFGVPGNYPTNGANPPASTSTSGTTGLTDMGGKTWGAMNTVIPQGWFMDGQGNFVFKGTPGSQTGQTSGVTTLPASYVTTAYNPAETAANLRAGGYTQQPDGSWVNTTKGAQDWQTIYGGGQANAPGTVPAPGAPGTTPTNQYQPLGNQGTNSNSNYLQQLIMGLLGGGQTGQQYQTVKTPLGYTQYQSSVPQGNSNDALLKMLVQALAGQQNTGGSQNSFWNLLGGTASGSGQPGYNASYNLQTGLPPTF